MQIDLRHLRTLVALRDTGSLADAAAEVCLTQSALSHQMKELEGRIGTELFVRKTRPVQFSAAGRRLLRLADDVLPQFASAERDLQRLAGGESGRLIMALECHSCFEWLLPAIERYRDASPDVEIDLASGFRFAPLPALLRGEIDLVITSDCSDQPDIAAYPLFGYEAVLVVAKDHPLAARPHVDAADLATQTLVTYPVDRDRLDLFTRFLVPAGVEPAQVRTAELTPMIIQLVASGRGVACLPNWAVHEYLGRTSIRTVRLGPLGVHPTLYASVRQDDVGAGYLRRFIAVARETCFANLTGIVEPART